MLKRYFSFFVLLLFLANSVGFNLATIVQLQFHHYDEAREEKVVDLQITIAEINSPASAFCWLKDDEFTFNGHLYDVIASWQENNVFHFKCHDDTKETALYEELEEQTEENENKNPLKNKQFSLKKGIEYDHAVFTFSCSSCNLSAEYLSTLELFAPIAFRPVASPPPWLV